MKKLILVLLLAATVAQAETYQWTDKEGTVHFSGSLGEVPATCRNSAKPLGLDINETTDTARAVPSAEPRQSIDDAGAVAPQVEELKGRMLKDDKSMALIRALQNDPQMQALLGDPAILRAIQSMDVAALMSNPDFVRLLNNPRVKEIEKRMQRGEAK